VKIPDTEKESLISLICQAFDLTSDAFMKLLLGVHTNGSNTQPGRSLSPDLDITVQDANLLRLVPPGWFHDYIQFTTNSEAPLAYHLFCSLLLVGASLGRRVWFDMGYFRVFPPLGVVLLGPSGIKKTTSADIAINIIVGSSICSIYAEKITPEALALSFTENAQGVIYAPEATVLMGKQKYNEGLIPLITRFMDCPDSFTPSTITRGATEIKNIACSVLMCSTTDWFIKNTPEDTFGGGFIARLLLVHQESSSRIQPIPKVMSGTEPKRLGQALLALREHTTGEVVFSPSAEDLYVEWYIKNKKDSVHPFHEILASYYQRKPIHVIRLSMILHLVNHQTKRICDECFHQALGILEWNEQFLPPMLRELFKTTQGQDHTFVLSQIYANGGVISHAALVRKVQYKMNAGQLRSILSSLKEARQVEELLDSLQHVWRVL
jgi:hypothetical protein